MHHCACSFVFWCVFVHRGFGVYMRKNPPLFSKRSFFPELVNWCGFNVNSRSFFWLIFSNPFIWVTQRNLFKNQAQEVFSVFGLLRGVSYLLWNGRWESEHPLGCRGGLQGFTGTKKRPRKTGGGGTPKHPPSLAPKFWDAPFWTPKFSSRWYNTKSTRQRQKRGFPKK